MDFSLIMPVRNNIKGLMVTLGAFDLFTHLKDKFEILLLVDNDDPDIDKYIDMCGDYEINIYIHVVKPTDNFSNDYYNWALQHCRGSNIMVWNDDCYMQTHAWDDKVRAKIESYSKFKGVYLVDMLDSTRCHIGSGVEFPRFPMISRKAVDLCGFFFFPTVRNWPADKCIWDLYSQVGCIIPCHEVKMQHDHNFDHSGDQSKSRFMRILQEDKANGVFPVDGRKESSRLIEALNA